MPQIPIRIASMGPADHGKSTLLGCLVLNHIDANAYWKNIKQLEQKMSWYRPDRAYTYMFDRSLDERKGYQSKSGALFFKGTSRTTSHIQCNIEGKEYLFIDVPGHDNFLKNATSGIFQAQTGVMVIAAPDLEDVIQAFVAKEKLSQSPLQTSRSLKHKLSHVFFCPILARVYAIDNLILAVSKMDRVKFEQYYYQLAVKELIPRLYRYSGLAKGKILTVPTSIDVFNRTDVNVITPANSNHPMSWYSGPTLLSRISKIDPMDPAAGRVLIPVETVYLKRIANAPLVLTGRIMRGKVTEGQKVQVIPLFDGSTAIHRPKNIEGRIRSIRPRGESQQLPWIGEIQSKKTDHDRIFEAGQVVGLNLHLNPKFTWAKKDARHFKRGCIVTEPNENIEMGNILRAEVFVPIFSRSLIPGDNWVVYLFGKNKGDALILSSQQKEGPFPTETGQEYAGYFAEIQIMLNFSMAYPASVSQVDAYPKDIALRHHESFCGGHVLSLCFPKCIEISWSNSTQNINFEEIQHVFNDLFRLKKISCKWKVEQNKTQGVTVTIWSPSMKDIQISYQKLDDLISDLSKLRVSINGMEK
jgi:translation elongation factor EF-1alpha